MDHNLARIRYITANFRYLQGLRNLPWGLFFLLVAGNGVGWYAHFGASRFGYLEGAVLLGCIVLYMAIGWYYDRVFGRVERSHARIRPQTLFFIGAIGAISLDVILKPPVFLLGLVFAAQYIWFYVEWRERVHFLITGILLALVSLLPLVPSMPHPAYLGGEGGALFFFILGLGMIIGGVLDHLLLLRTLPPAPIEEELNHA